MEQEIGRTAIPSQVIEIWQRVVDTIADLLRVPSVMINRLSPPDLEVFRSNLGSENPFPAGTTMPMLGVYCAEAAERRQKLQIVDARTDPLWADSPTARAGIFAYLGYPILWPSGDVFGTICAVDTKENKWGKEAENLLLAFKDAVEAHLALAVTMGNLNRKNRELQAALSEVRILKGLLPICTYCKKIRDDEGYWNHIESYIKQHANVDFSHSICPDCGRRLYPDIYDEAGMESKC